MIAVMKLPTLMKPKLATISELKINLQETASGLDEAKAEATSAQAKYDTDGSTYEAHNSARNDQKVAQDHFDRAERLLEKAEAQKEADDREGDEKTLKALENRTAPGVKVERRKSAMEEELKCLLKAAHAREARRQIEQGINADEIERDGLKAKLTGELMRSQTRTDEPSNVDIDARLEEFVRLHHTDPTLRHYVGGLRVHLRECGRRGVMP